MLQVFVLVVVIEAAAILVVGNRCLAVGPRIYLALVAAVTSVAATLGAIGLQLCENGTRTPDDSLSRHPTGGKPVSGWPRSGKTLLAR